MDIEQLFFRASVLQQLRSFFINKKFLELDTPALSKDLIPETCLEVFKTQYIEPWSNKKHNLFLVPSPEIYIKKIIAQHKVSVFQLSKCYRNIESVGHTHSPEFTMLEYYTMNYNYKDSLLLTEELFKSFNTIFKLPENLTPPFNKITVNEAFYECCGFYLDECITASSLAEKAKGLDLLEPDTAPFSTWTWEELYNLIFVQLVEPNLCNIFTKPNISKELYNKPVFLLDYPAKVDCLAQNISPQTTNLLYKERWELYANGIELANCYSEETNPINIKEYFMNEGKLKKQDAIVKHDIDKYYWKNFGNKNNSVFPKCSGVAMGIDRLIMILLEKRTIDSVLPFPLKYK